MKSAVLLLLCLSVLTTAAPASQQAKAAPTAPTKAAAATPAPAAKPAAAHTQAPKSAPPAGLNLETVLDKMDAAAANFQTLQANFVWDQLTSVVNEHSIQKGVIYFRRTPRGEMEMAAEVSDPGKKYVVFSGGKVRMYEPNLNRVTEYNAGKNRADVESFLVLGFGGRGHDLVKSYDVKFAGTETVDGINTARLQLTPKSARMQSMFSQITLWIDPARGISVQQQFTEPSGDYRLAKYTDINPHPKLSDDVFKLKTPPGVEVVRPQG